MDYVLPAFAGVIALTSVLLFPRAESEGPFYKGISATGKKPSLPTVRGLDPTIGAEDQQGDL